jgi:electron transfer flavoprotein beta subunit
MKIFVPIKRVPDTDQKIRVRSDGLAIEGDLPYVINPFDAIALEEALRIRESRSDESEVVVVGIGGDEYEKELRTALAMGADRAILVTCLEPLDPWNVAQLLKAVVEREQPDLVVPGKQAVDDDSNQVGQFLAALLNWPQATFASRVEFLEADENPALGQDVGGRQQVRVARETDAGIEIVRMGLPAVVTADLRLNEPRYASLPNIMKAKRKPLDRIDSGELGVAIEPRIEILKLEAPESQRSCVRVKDADELLKRLADEAKVL